MQRLSHAARFSTARPKTSRLFLLSFLLLSFLSSCNSWQYITLESRQMTRDTGNALIFENDTLRLAYDFHGEGGPLRLTVYNKTNQPLYAFWTRSALIRDGHSYSLFNRRVQVDGSVSSAFVSTGGHAATSYSSGNFHGSFNLPEGADLIAPHSDISRELIPLEPPAIVAPDSPALKLMGADGYYYKVKTFNWAPDSSPLHFSSFLTLALGNDPNAQFNLTNEFYAKRLVETHEQPNTFLPDKGQGDLLYVKKPMQ